MKSIKVTGIVERERESSNLRNNKNRIKDISYSRKNAIAGITLIALIITMVVR